MRKEKLIDELSKGRFKMDEYAFREIRAILRKSEITMEFIEKKTTELHDKLWPEEKCNNLCRRQAIIREFLSSLLDELSAKINLTNKEEQ